MAGQNEGSPRGKLSGKLSELAGKLTHNSKGSSKPTDKPSDNSPTPPATSGSYGIPPSGGPVPLPGGIDASGHSGGYQGGAPYSSAPAGGEVGWNGADVTAAGVEANNLQQGYAEAGPSEAVAYRLRKTVGPQRSLGTSGREREVYEEVGTVPVLSSQ